jgi:plasmid stabilization system protein ParE
VAAVEWSEDAHDALDAICAFIALDSPSAADVFSYTVTEATRSLALFPRAGRVVPEFGREDIRELIVGNYRVVYLLIGDAVRIVTIHHGARMLRLGPDRLN